MNVIKAWIMQYALALTCALVCIVGLWGGIQTWRLSRAKDQLTVVQGHFDSYVAAANANALAAEQAYKVEREALLKNQGEELNHAQAQTDVARVDAGLAASALNRLRQRASAGACRCQAVATPAASSPGQATQATGAMQDDVLRRMGEAAGQLAVYADKSRIAGSLCEKDYDALK